MSFAGVGCALAVAFLGAWAPLGCGGTVVDDSKAEASIEQNLEDSAGKKVEAVECPSGVDVEKDGKFSCTVTLEGGKEELAKMKILNEDADLELSDLEPAK